MAYCTSLVPARYSNTRYSTSYSPLVDAFTNTTASDLCWTYFGYVVHRNSINAEMIYKIYGVQGAGSPQY